MGYGTAASLSGPSARAAGITATRVVQVAATIVAIATVSVGVFFGGDRAEAPAASRTAAGPGLSEVTYEMANWTDCSSYDDDDAYTAAACGSFDVAACNHHCASGWCLELCGDACFAGEGAVCAAGYLEDLATTCAAARAAGAEPTRSLAGEATPFGAGKLFGNELSNGCDHHVYCDFCGVACRAALKKYPYGELYAGKLNVGPHAMRLLTNLTQVCAEEEASHSRR